jgi:PHD/YefM family antitoxin component YafN of YafNO toxin-antitoxin module
VVRYLPTGGAHIGYKAQAEAVRDPKNTIISVKRFMGRGLKDVAHIENTPYDFVDAPGMVQLKTVAGVKSPVEVSAEILATLGEQREPLVITQNGEAKAVLQDVASYEATQETLALLKVLALGQQEVAAGKVKPLSDTVARLKAKKASA